MNIIAPSMLACDFGNLNCEIEMVNKSEANWFHIDVMDGVFVPNISFGTPIMKVLKKNAKKTLDVHLMIVNPDNYLESFAELGADILTVHYEACTHLHRTVQRVKDLKMKAGVAINPHTPITSLKSIIKEIDLVCIMSVNPGFGGQTFINSSLGKIKTISDLVGKRPINIQVDGGVNSEIAPKVIKAGANVIVAGSAVFKEGNVESYKQNIKSLRH